MKYIVKYWIVIAIVFGLSMFIKPAFCFIIFGSVIFYICIEAWLLLNRLQKNGIACAGKIVGCHTDGDGDETPLIEFTTMAGGLITEKPYVSTSAGFDKLRSYENMINQPVSVLYDPNDPKKFILAGGTGINYFVFILFILAGLAIVVMGVCGFLGYIKIG